MIATERLLLREWRDADRAPFHAMSQSAAVMAHLGGVSDWRGVDGAIADMRALQVSDGHCFWAMERRADGKFIGFCGLERIDLPGTPIDGEVEIGWRLREDAWGQGFAREAAEASLDFGFTKLDLARIVAITVPANRASWGLMLRLGMTHRTELDFGHPAFAEGHPLRAHVTYAIDRPA